MGKWSVTGKTKWAVPRDFAKRARQRKQAGVIERALCIFCAGWFIVAGFTVKSNGFWGAVGVLFLIALGLALLWSNFFPAKHKRG